PLSTGPSARQPPPGLSLAYLCSQAVGWRTAAQRISPTNCGSCCGQRRLVVGLRVRVRPAHGRRVRATVRERYMTRALFALSLLALPTASLGAQVSVDFTP